ncbi:GNAT family N-acetyltransferase [Aquidulcibacter sp.]|uniref:GNAT family N-acetyltransferase n=1 Tax=Aquidulcibacter sp. TaxID=2052990 RepID=UPI0025C204E5|nr:GNAT family N-acetyltransferase [Aquidulcibacter sp.]MCA3693707.1 GNAT family N-acetyltransferase [Aquidulcibacter sp.]
MAIRQVSRDDFAWVIALGNANQVETGPLDEDRLTRLVEASYLSQVAEPDLGFLITFIPTSRYDSPNFVWFVERMDNFVYVDRIVVAAHARGQGIARRLYEGLFARAEADGYEHVVCEVNSDPPNPISDQFHAALGCTPVGQATLSNGKSVTYLSRALKV